MGYDSTAKSVITARERGAVRPGSQGVLRAYSLSTVGEYRLGAAIWELKYEGGKAGAFNTAALLLTRYFQDHLRRSGTILRAICEAALTEYLADQCPRCKGRGRTGAGREVMRDVRLSCRACRGAGRLFSSSARSGSTIERPCEPCGGRGWTSGTKKVNSRLRSCLACNGSGRRIWRDRDRAQLIGMTGHEFQKWKPVHLVAMTRLRGLDLGTSFRVDLRLGRDENLAQSVLDEGRPNLPPVTAEHPAEEEELGAIPGTMGQTRPEEWKAPP